MKRARFHLSAAKQASFADLFERFLFGGTVTVLTGVVATTWGPEIGGLFLAFPATLPASLSLAHKRDGRESAVQAARGARLGAVGLAGFALAVMLFAERGPFGLTLFVAMLAWVIVSISAWMYFVGTLPRRRRH